MPQRMNLYCEASLLMHPTKIRNVLVQNRKMFCNAFWQALVSAVTMYKTHILLTKLPNIMLAVNIPCILLLVERQPLD